MSTLNIEFWQVNILADNHDDQSTKRCILFEAICLELTYYLTFEIRKLFSNLEWQGLEWLEVNDRVVYNGYSLFTQSKEIHCSKIKLFYIKQ